MALKKPGYNSVFVNIYTLCGGVLRQSRHGHDIACENNDKACARGDFNIFNGHREILGSAEKSGIIGKAVLRFCNADRAVRKAVFIKGCNLLLCGGEDINSFSAVYFFDYGFNFLFNSAVKRIAEGEIALFLLADHHQRSQQV